MRPPLPTPAGWTALDGWDAHPPEGEPVLVLDDAGGVWLATADERLHWANALTGDGLGFAPRAWRHLPGRTT